MNLLHFLRLLKNHSRLLIGMPALFAGMIFLTTLNQPKEYKSSTVVYTGLTAGQGLTGDDSRIDFYAVNSSFDNLIGLINSREILERTGVRLLARHLSRDREGASILEDASLRSIQHALADQLGGSRSNTSSIDSIYSRLIGLKAASPLADILAGDTEPYAPEYIAKRLKAKRVGTSDMLEITYTANDPDVTQATLSILTELFLSEFRLLKIQQAGSAVRFFEGEVQRAGTRLKGISEDLKSFRIHNRIINYEEQTKQVTVQGVYIESEYRDELRKLSAAEAALAELNRKTEIRALQMTDNEVVAEKTHRLSDVMTMIALAEVNPADSLGVRRLKQEADHLKQEVRTSVAQLYQTLYSKEGLTSKTLVDQWLTQYLQTIEQQARVKVMKEHQISLQKKFDLFAPLGSTLHNYEREIDVAEREYLELLHSLNLARLYQQNLEITSNIRIVDTPNYPRAPEPSKRAILIIAGWFAGALLCVSGIVTLEYLDHSLRTPQRAELLTGLSVASAIPHLATPVHPTLESALRQGVEHLVRTIKLSLNTMKSERPGPKIVILCSIFPGDGKTTVATNLVKRLKGLGHTAIALAPATTSAPDGDTREDLITYDLPDNFYDAASLDQFVSNPDRLRRVQYVVLEIPSLLYSSIPLKILQLADLVYLVVRTDRTWGKAEANILKVFSQVGRQTPEVILNGVKEEQMEELVGELPKERSSLRKFVKRIARLQMLS